MNATQMHERVVAIAAEHRSPIHVPERCDICFLLDVIRTAVARDWDPFTGLPASALGNRISYVGEVALSSGAAKWLSYGRHGISSMAMFSRLALGETGNGTWSSGRDYPHDANDFLRCELLLRAAPDLRDRLPLMGGQGAVWAGLVERWDEIVALIESDAPGSLDAHRITGTTHRSYALIHSIVEAGRVAEAAE